MQKCVCVGGGGQLRLCILEQHSAPSNSLSHKRTSCAYLQNQPARRLRARVCSQITRVIFLSCHGQSFTMRQRKTPRTAARGERMKENTYRKRENEVPQGTNRSGFGIELGEVRDDAREQTVVQLMMISLFDVHVIALLFFLPEGEMQREKRICVSFVPSG